ncbi:MAG TPA: O-antigen ligase family protein [Rhizomicrobium sp.]|jgi:exopolysaccharide production protein ExoQ|nr:O-antigen ligase family protein [Rhizomicrobium sp.]
MITARSLSPNGTGDVDGSGAAATPLEYVFGFVVIFLFQGAFFPLLRERSVADTAAQLAQGNPIARAFQGIALVVMVLIVVARRKTMFPVIFRAQPFILIIGICLVSALWSQDPFLTVRRSLSLMDCFLFGYYAFAVYGPRNTVRLLATGAIVAASASLMLAVVAPHIAFESGIRSDVGSLIGVFSQKNELSVNILTGFCSCMYLGFIASNRSRFDRLVGWCTPIIILVLLLSHGLTSIIASLFVSLSTIVFFAGIRSRLLLLGLYCVGAVALVGVVATLMNPEMVFHFFGKDSTLTGRLPLWIDCLGAIKDRPLFGYGYSAFWLPGTIEAEYIWSRIGWYAPSAHDGFLQLALDIGLVGTCFYLFLITRLIQLTIRATRVGELSEARWVVLFLISMLIENLDEGTLAWPDLLAAEVAFSAALTETWWRSYVLKIRKNSRPARFSTWSERFDMRSRASVSNIAHDA